jgi:hypothetical protein
MAVQDFRVQVETATGTGTITLSNVQSINFKTGRERQLDQYSSMSGTIVVRQPSAPSPIIVPGSVVYVQWKNGASYTQQFFATISNVQIEYGIPYAGGVANADYLIISVEGYLANCGRASGQNYAMAAGSLFSQCAAANTASGLTINGFNVPVFGTGPQMGSTTVSGTWGDWVNYVCLTINGRISETQNQVALFGSAPYQTATVNFSDTTNNATNYCYEKIEFGSYSNNYYTQTTVKPESFATQTVQTGSAPYRTYSVNTVNASASQGLDYANWLLNNFKTPNVAPTSISMFANAQNNFSGINNLQVGTQVNITFRGTTYTAVIEGWAFSAQPGDARYTFYVSAADLNAYLILDNATFGKLDSNKLGY